MKPNPLSSLNHLTVPIAIVFPPALIVLRTRRLLSKGYDRWHRDVGRITRPDLATVAASTIGRWANAWRDAPRGRAALLSIERERRQANHSPFCSLHLFAVVALRPGRSSPRQSSRSRVGTLAAAIGLRRSDRPSAHQERGLDAPRRDAASPRPRPTGRRGPRAVDC